MGNKQLEKMVEQLIKELKKNSYVLILSLAILTILLILFILSLAYRGYPLCR